MELSALKAASKHSAFDFDDFLKWRLLDGKVVPALKTGGAQPIAAESHLLDDASILFGDPSPCLQDDGGAFDILCEGDSWMCLSIYGPGHVTMAQQLARLGYSVGNIAKYSRTSQEVQRRKNTPTGYRTMLKREPRAFMVSMGGNDFLGEAVKSWLRQRASDDTDPTNAPNYIDFGEFDLILKAVEANYRRLIADVKAVSPSTHLIFQTYAYAEPTHVTGPFLGQHFDSRGFDPINSLHRPLIHAIIKLIIDRFRRLLVKLRNLHPGTIDIVDFRDLLHRGDFRDEIHPRPEFAPAMAQRYADVLTRIGVPPPSV
jgi:hypothetical protein